jgi:hypothetical protein
MASLGVVAFATDFREPLRITLLKNSRFTGPLAPVSWDFVLGLLDVSPGLLS